MSVIKGLLLLLFAISSFGLIGWTMQFTTDSHDRLSFMSKLVELFFLVFHWLLWLLFAFILFYQGWVFK